MEGYLKKWVNVVSGWKSRYFVLHDGILTYCDKKGEPIKGNISLKVANIISIPEDPLRIVLETGTSEIHIRTSTMSEKIKWFSALKDAQEKALKEDEYKSYPEQEIQLYEGRLSIGTKAILNESNLDKLKDDLAELWVKQSQFDETLSLLAPKAQKVPGINELASKLEELGKEIKV
jgi:PH domain.